MADDLEQTGRPDDQRGSAMVKDVPEELRRWAEEFGVTEQELRQVVAVWRRTDRIRRISRCMP